MGEEVTDPIQAAREVLSRARERPWFGEAAGPGRYATILKTAPGRVHLGLVERRENAAAVLLAINTLEPLLDVLEAAGPFVAGWEVRRMNEREYRNPGLLRAEDHEALRTALTRALDALREGGE